MFENLMREYDRIFEQTEDHIQRAKEMTAEFGLCCRLQKSKETLIKEYEERKIT